MIAQSTEESLRGSEEEASDRVEEHAMVQSCAAFAAFAAFDVALCQSRSCLLRLRFRFLGLYVRPGWQQDKGDLHRE